MVTGSVADLGKPPDPIARLAAERSGGRIVGISNVGFPGRKVFQRDAVQGVIGKGNHLALGVGLGGKVVVQVIGVRPAPHVRIGHGGLTGE